MKRALLAATLCLGTLSVGTLSACQKPPSAERTADQGVIRALLHQQFDRPGSNLDLDPVAISGDTAVVDWTQGTMGGRALLRRQDGTWSLSMCGGDGLKTAAGLKSAGVPTRDADTIAATLAAAEARMTPAKRQQLDSFGANVPMGPGAPRKDH